MKNKKRKGLYSEMTGTRGKVKFLQPYYYQGGKWHKLKTAKRG